MKKAFTVIEILIAMLILFSAIVFVNTTIKAFNNFQRKSNQYQHRYITILSLKDWVETQPLNKKNYQGKINGFNYEIKVKKITKSLTYKFVMGMGSSNIGDYEITLYEVRIILKNEKQKKEVKFFLTKEKSKLKRN